MTGQPLHTEHLVALLSFVSLPSPETLSALLLFVVLGTDPRVTTIELHTHTSLFKIFSTGDGTHDLARQTRMLLS